MEKIAVIYGQYTVFWSSVVMTLAAGIAVCLFLALYLPVSGNVRAAAVLVPLAAAASVFGARLVHWYCREDSYESLLGALTDFSSGGYALAGVFGGCILAAVFVRILKITEDLPQMLDCMSVAGCGGIAVGRLSFFFNNGNRGMVLKGFQELPLAAAVTNPVSGLREYRLATFFLQSLGASVLFVLLMVFLIWEKKKSRRSGDTALVFLLCYGAVQVLLDSTRYDSLYFRSNGFVSVVQVLGALGIALAAAVFSVRLVRYRKWRFWYPGLWLALAALFGLGGYMEYYVQRRGHEAAFAYSVMGASLLGLVGLTLWIRALGESARQQYVLSKSREQEHEKAQP